jgi:chitinase
VYRPVPNENEEHVVKRRYLVTLIVLATLAAPVWGSTALAAAHPRVVPVERVAPYEYLGWGHPQGPLNVMRATGIRDFTLAFMLSDGFCNPRWDGTRPLLGGRDEATIRRIRAHGGDVVVSFGGWSGAKLGVRCPTAALLAAAYEKVIGDYGLKAMDIDIEHTEIATAAVRQRVVDALKLVRQREPWGFEISITFGCGEHGPDADSRDMIRRAAVAGLRVNAWTIMPFDFGAPVRHMGRISLQAAEGLKRDLMAAFHESGDVAYRRMGISSMNGRTDESDETVTKADFTMMLDYARAHHLARFTFWSLNRDRPCPRGGASDSCSGIGQAPYAFTKVVAQYHG